MVVSKDMAKKAVVTGGGGFIGSTIAHKLVEAGYETHLVELFDTLPIYVTQTVLRRSSLAPTWFSIPLRSREFHTPLSTP
jgi:nucleoside-diphosphate-sugar epimerase